MAGFRLDIHYGTTQTVAILRTPDGQGIPLPANAPPLPPPGFAPPPVEPAAAALHAIWSAAARMAGGSPIATTITHPGAPYYRDLLGQAAGRAGVPSPTLVPEGTSAGRGRWWIVGAAGVAAVMIVAVVVGVQALRGGGTTDQRAGGPGGAPRPGGSAEPVYAKAPRPRDLLTADEVGRYVPSVRCQQPSSLYEHGLATGAAWYTWSGRSCGGGAGNDSFIQLGVERSASVAAARDQVGAGTTVDVGGAQDAVIASGVLWLRFHNVVVIVVYSKDGADASDDELAAIGGLAAGHMPAPH